MLYFLGLVLATGFSLAIAAFAGALGQSRAVASALESMARQPEAANRVQMAMIIGLAFIESLVIYSLLIFFLLQGKLPDTKAILDIVQKAAGG